MLGELIVVESQKIEAVISEKAPNQHRESATWKELNEFHFAALWSILLNKTDFEVYESKIKVITAEEGEVWIVVLPAEFRDLIAAHHEKDISYIVSQWAIIDEFKWGWESKDIENLFKDLTRLANIAKQNGKDLIYWGRL